MTCQHYQILKNISNYHNMQYQVHPMCRTLENVQKPLFLGLWIIQKCISTTFEWSRISDTMAKSFRPFSRIKICNIKLTRWTKLEKMANSTPGGAPAAYASHEKFSQKSTRIFPDMQFSRGSPKKALLSYLGLPDSCRWLFSAISHIGHIVLGNSEIIWE